MVDTTSKEKTISKDINGNEFNRTIFIITLLIGSFVSILNSTILATALPRIMDYFKITASTAQWLTTAFLLVNAIMIPLTALLIEKFSTKRLFMFSMIIFGVGTLVCAFSLSFECLLIGRMIQAVGAGIMMPLINTVFLLIFPIEKRGFAMGLYGLVASFAPAIGPTLAGLVIDRWSWHILFYMLIPIIVVDIIFACLFMRNVSAIKNPKIDILSIILSTAGFGSMLYGLSSAGNKGWSNIEVIVTIIAGFIITALFVLRQLTMENPVLEMRVFKSKTFSLTTVMVSILNIASVCATIIIPIFLQSILGRSAFISGLVVMPGAIMMAVSMLISGRLFDKYGVKKLALSGIILLVIATLPFTNLHKDSSVLFITVLYAFRFIGISFALMPLQAAGMNALSNKLLPHATAVVNMSKQLAGSLGTAVLITVMSNVTKSNAPDKTLMTTNSALYKSGMLEAAIKGINITFMIATAITILSLILTFFLQGIQETTPQQSKLNEKINQKTEDDV